MGSPISILHYEQEIKDMLRTSKIADPYFSTDKQNYIAVITSFEKAIGSFNYQIKISFYPNTYIIPFVRFTKNLAFSLGRSKSNLIVILLWVIYILLIVADITVFSPNIIRKIIDVIK